MVLGLFDEEPPQQPYRRIQGRSRPQPAPSAAITQQGVYCGGTTVFLVTHDAESPGHRVGKSPAAGDA
jgi:hypothetical protein